MALHYKILVNPSRLRSVDEPCLAVASASASPTTNAPAASTTVTTTATTTDRKVSLPVKSTLSSKDTTALKMTSSSSSSSSSSSYSSSSSATVVLSQKTAASTMTSSSSSSSLTSSSSSSCLTSSSSSSSQSSTSSSSNHRRHKGPLESKAKAKVEDDANSLQSSPPVKPEPILIRVTRCGGGGGGAKGPCGEMEAKKKPAGKSQRRRCETSAETSKDIDVQADLPPILDEATALEANDAPTCDKKIESETAPSVTSSHVTTVLTTEAEIGQVGSSTVSPKSREEVKDHQVAHEDKGQSVGPQNIISSARY